MRSRQETPSRILARKGELAPSITAGLRVVGAATLVALSVGGRTARASSGPPQETGWKPFGTVTPWVQGGSDLDGGGGFHASGVMLSAGVDGPIRGRYRAGLTVSYGYTEYVFSSPTTFGNGSPWTDVHHVGLAAPFLFLGSAAWAVMVVPSLDYFVEDGADWSEAPSYGAVLAVSRRFGPDLMLGFGAGVFDRFGELEAFPFVVIDWKIGDRLRLSNPLQAGPTGGAGLELSYQLGGGWALGAGGAYRSARFRLRADGPFPDDLGEERAVPAFVHLARRFGARMELDLYAGALFAGQLHVEDSGGGTEVEQDFDPAPLVGVTFSARR